MASTYTTSLKIQEIGSGEQSGVWGSTTNTNWTLIEQAVAGVQTITMANANYTLTNLNGVLDEARNMVLVVQGTNSGIYQVIIPANQPKMYVIYNNTTGGYTITIGTTGVGGTLISIPNGVTAQVYTDGTNTYSAQTGSAGNFNVNGNLTAAGVTDTGALSAASLTVSGAASLATGSISGIMTAPTASTGTNTTQIATTAFVATATGSLGTMSTQNANSVAITGGTINGVTGTASGLTVGTATNATNATNATYATNPASGGSFITSSNIGSQSVSFATNATNATNATTATNATNATNAVNATNATNATNAGTATNANQFQGKTKLGLGITGETWHDVTGSRSQGVPYPNSNAYPISVSICFGTNNDQSWSFYVDGVRLGFLQEHQDFNGAWMGGIVPPGGTYIFYGNYMSTWSELY